MDGVDDDECVVGFCVKDDIVVVILQLLSIIIGNITVDFSGNSCHCSTLNPITISRIFWALASSSRTWSLFASANFGWMNRILL